MLLDRPVVAGLVQAGDVVLVLGASGLAGWLRFGAPAPAGDDLLLLLQLSGTLGAALVFAVCVPYAFDELRDIGRQLARLVGAWSADVAGLLVLLYALKSGEQVSRLWIGYWWLAGCLALIAWRAAVAVAITVAQRAGHLRRRVVLLGTPGARAALASRLAQAETGVTVAGALDPPSLQALSAPGHPLRRCPELAAFLLERPIDEVIVGAEGLDPSVLERLIAWLRCFPLAIGVEASGLLGRLPILGLGRIGGAPLVRLIERPLDGWRLVLKTLEDRLLGSLFLVLAAPFMLGIAVAVKLSSPGPVLFRQLRHGFNQEPIEVLKFRTMYVERCDAPDAARVRQATRDDPRVTPLGRFLRRTSLDELPQLVNVVRGEMSLVGPRPHALAHNDTYAALIDGYLGRHRVKPGITGWAQVNGCRGETATLEEMERRIAYDIEYVERWSLRSDLVILARTAAAVLRARGAW